MNRALGSAVGIVLAACALQGCLASTVVLRVKPDGSGTAVATLQVNRAAMQDFERALGAPMGPLQLEDRYPQPDNSALEKFFGTRVTLVSSTLTPTADGFARETTVAFGDVTKIQLPCPLFVDSMTPGQGFSSSPFGSPLITFATRPHENGDRLLIVRIPDDPIDQRPEPRPDPHPLTAAEQQEQALLKRAARGGAIHLFVELETTLLRTNAPARDGNRATILDVDFSKLLNGPAFENTVATPSPLSLQELLWQLGDMPGALTPDEREVFLEFEPPTPSTPPPSQPPARPAAPDTEIFLAPLTVSGQHITIGQPVNISNSPGYDNQPSFTPDGQRLLFTSARGGAQTDIYRYDLASKQVTQVTNTPESEYSPTVTPDHGLSVVRVEADGSQRLWRFTSDGGDPRVLLENVKPVGLPRLVGRPHPGALHPRPAGNESDVDAAGCRSANEQRAIDCRRHRPVVAADSGRPHHQLRSAERTRREDNAVDQGARSSHGCDPPVDAGC